MTRYQRSAQIWSLLICAAWDRKIYNYGGIAERLGIPGPGEGPTVRGLLLPIMYYCQKKKFPPLTTLVVSLEAGVSAEDLTTIEDVNRERERVFDFNWFAVEPPQTSDFEKAWNER